MDKQVLRREILARRQAQTVEVQQQLSQRIVSALKSMGFLHKAERVLAYLPFRGEVDLTSLCDWLEGLGKQLAFPKVTDKVNGEMEPYFVAPPWRLNVEPGSFGLLEPAGHIRLADPAKLEVVLVPGVAFDRNLYRLGFGGGFYDRFLPRLGPQALKIGIAYSFQLIGAVPRDMHDVAVDAVCTENGLLLR